MPKPYKAFFPEFWSAHERVWTLPKKQSLRRLLLHDTEFDSDGIIFVRYRFLEGGGKEYVPIRIMQHALRFYNEWMSTHDAKKRVQFEKYAEWLIHHAVVSDWRACWPHKRPMKLAGYRFSGSWIGCMDQGFALSVLLRYHSLQTDKKKKARIASMMKGIVNTFGRTVEHGGVRDESDGVWFEEFGAVERAHVLNGFMYALMGLYEYASYSKSMDAKRFFNEGIRTLEKQIQRFETSLGPMRWTRYDSRKLGYAGWHYHGEVHVPQAKILYEITGREFLLSAHKRWLKWSDDFGMYARVLDPFLLGLQKLRGILGL